MSDPTSDDLPTVVAIPNKSPSAAPSEPRGDGAQDHSSAQLRLQNRFALLRPLNRGGMSTIYLARDLELGREVAIKTLRTDHLKGDRARVDWLRLFRRDAASTARLRHPHIVTLHDFGVEQGLPFLVLEYLKGQSLKNLLAAGAITLDQTLEWSRQLASALAHAHAQGVIHRDLKPGNIFIQDSTYLKVLDFGIASLRAEVTQLSEAFQRDTEELKAYLGNTLTRAGTPRYMAPEQMRGDPQDRRVDLWSFGLLLYEMLTGERPFDTPLRSLTETAPRVREKNLQVPLELDGLIAQCLQRRPDGRPQDFDAVLATIDNIDAARRPISAVSFDTPRTNLPPSPNRFVGRDHAIQQLHGRLVEGSRVITLMGAPGVGKSRLAHEVGLRVADIFHGGVVRTNLSAAVDDRALITEVARALGHSDLDGIAHDEITKILQQRGRVLIILDDFEHIASHAPSTLGEWVKTAPQTSFLVTSRQRLGVQGEVVIVLEPLTLPADPTDLEQVTAASASQLLIARAHEAGHDITLDDNTAPHLGQLVETLDGLPLAIELAAAHLGEHDLQRLGALLQRRFDSLINPSAPAASHHASLYAAVERSWQRLEAWEQSALAQASIFVGGFTLDAAEEVINLDHWPHAPFVIDVIESLVDKSLLRASLTFDEDSTLDHEPRFAMLNGLQMFAKQHLGDVETAAALASRHATFYVALSEDLLASITDLDELQRYVFERHNFARAAKHQLAQLAIDEAAALLLSASCAIALERRSSTHPEHATLLRPPPLEQAQHTALIDAVATRLWSPDAFEHGDPDAVRAARRGAEALITQLGAPPSLVTRVQALRAAAPIHEPR